jgi:tRNA (guanine-N7-)-methyltransferase
MDSANTSVNHPPRRQTYGRRLGRPLSAQRLTALERLADYALTPADLPQNGSVDPEKLFPVMVEQTWMEIGFGAGEHLIARINQNPTFGYIGAEPYLNGVSALLDMLPHDNAKGRLRLHDQDAMEIVRSLKTASLDGMFILNPDPWPKLRHHKRRIVRPETLDHFARILKPGAAFILSTDVAELAGWMVTHTVNHPEFTWTAKAQADWQNPPTDWPLTTRFMARGMAAGRAPHFLVFSRK